MIAFAEACVGIGLVVSGVILVAVGSVIYTGEIAPIELIMPLAFVGASLGDHVGFYVGRRIGPRFHHLEFTRKYSKPLGRAEQMIRKYGAFAIFIGRFIPAIRSLIPALLGISEFSRGRYTVLDLSACFLWAMGLGAIIVGVGNVF